MSLERNLCVNMKRKVDVGDVIFVVNKASISAYQVTDETTVRSLSTDSETSYTIKSTDGSKAKLTDNSNVEYYTSLEEARKVFVKRASDAIDKMLSNVREAAASAFGNVTEKPVAPIKDVSDEPSNTQEAQVIELPDGTKAKVKMSPEAARMLANS